MNFAKLLPAELEGRSLLSRCGIVLAWVGDALENGRPEIAHALCTSALVVLWAEPELRQELLRLLESIEKAMNNLNREVPQA